MSFYNNFPYKSAFTFLALLISAQRKFALERANTAQECRFAIIRVKLRSVTFFLRHVVLFFSHTSLEVCDA